MNCQCNYSSGDKHLVIVSLWWYNMKNQSLIWWSKNALVMYFKDYVFQRLYLCILKISIASSMFSG